MPYQKSQMIYKDQYKWTSGSANDNPKIIGGTDHSQLNRQEGYEMLYFINSLAKSWNWKDNLSSYQNLEKYIQNEVPSTIRTHSGIKQWIESQVKSF